MKRIISAFVISAVLAIGSVEKSEASWYVQIVEICENGFYHAAQSDPTIWCQGQWLPGSTLADNFRHRYTAYFVTNPGTYEDVAYDSFSGNVGDHTWYVLCSPITDTGYMFGYFTAYDNTTPVLATSDDTGGSVAGVQGCGQGGEYQ